MMKIRISMAGLLLVSFLSTSVFAMENFIYRSPNKIDLIKLEKAKGDEKEGLKHPSTFGPEQIREILRSIHFNKKILLIKDIEDRRLFDEKNVEFLAPYLMEAFQKAKSDQVVVASYFTTEGKFVLSNDRLTIFRAFVKDDGLHIKFTKIYAKMMGDRVTKGALRTTADARSMRVALELQQGQNRIAWKPEELVFDLNYYGPDGHAVGEKKGKKDKKSDKEVKGDEKPAKGKETEAKAAEDNAKSVRVRLKELDQLKKDELITEKEYQKKRRDLIDDL